MRPIAGPPVVSGPRARETSRRHKSGPTRQPVQLAAQEHRARRYFHLERGMFEASDQYPSIDRLCFACFLLAVTRSVSPPPEGGSGEVHGPACQRKKGSTLGRSSGATPFASPTGHRTSFIPFNRRWDSKDGSHNGHFAKLTHACQPDVLDFESVLSFLFVG